MLTEHPEAPAKIALERDIARARAAFLENAIRTVVEDGYFVVATTWRADGVPSKNDTCIHGNSRYAGCSACECDYLTRALKGVSDGKK